MLRLLFLKFVWMLRVKSKQQNTRPNRTYFSNDKNSLKMHGDEFKNYGYLDLPTSRLLLNSPRWLNTMTGDETGRTSLQLIGSCTSTPSLPTQPMKGCTTPPGSTPLTLYEQQCGFFYAPQESEQWKNCKTAGPTDFCPFPRRLECLTICRCYNKGNKFSSVVLRPWVLVQLGFVPTTSRLAERQTKSLKRERSSSKLTAFPLYRWHNQNGLVESLMVM